MHLYDVNILIYAHRTDTPRHAEVKAWFETELNQPFAMSELVLSAFVRVVTMRRLFDPPTPLE